MHLKLAAKEAYLVYVNTVIFLQSFDFMGLSHMYATVYI